MTVNWLTQIVTIPQGDLTFVSGTFYKGPTDGMRILMKEKEASETGIVFPDISRHNTEVGPIVGTTYARTIEIINGYSLTFSPDSAWSVQLEGSNNNMWDVGGGILNQNQVQVIPTNSAGLQIVTSGSGVTEQDKVDIADEVWEHATAVSVETSIIRILGLTHENFRWYNQIYDGNNNLTSGSMKIYPSKVDLDADTNSIEEYVVTATYDGGGLLDSYKVGKL